VVKIEGMVILPAVLSVWDQSQLSDDCMEIYLAFVIPAPEYFSQLPLQVGKIVGPEKNRQHIAKRQSISMSGTALSGKKPIRERFSVRSNSFHRQDVQRIAQLFV
jgi:hypothetical protein